MQSLIRVFIYAGRTELDEFRCISALSVDEDIFSGGIISKGSFNQCWIECDLSICHSTAGSMKPSSPRAAVLIFILTLSDLKGVRQSFASFCLFRGYFVVLCITAHERRSTKTRQPWNDWLKKACNNSRNYKCSLFLNILLVSSSISHGNIRSNS